MEVALLIAILILIALGIGFWGTIISAALVAWGFISMIFMFPPVYFIILAVMLYGMAKLVDEEEAIGAGVILFFTALWSSFYFGGPVVAYKAITSINLVTLLAYAGIYLSGGVLGGIWKFWRYSVERFGYFEDWKAKWKKDNKIAGDITGEDKSRFFQAIASRYIYDGVTIEDLESRGIAAVAPRARENKARLTTWAIFWPVWLTWDLFHNPFRRFFNFCFDLLKKPLQWVSETTFRRGCDDVK